MNSLTNTYSTYFQITHDSQGVVFISPNTQDTTNTGSFLVRLEQLVDMISKQLEQAEVKGVIFKNPLFEKSIDYRSLFKEAFDKEKFKQRLTTLVSKFLALQRQQKPLVGLLHEDCFSIQLSSMLWAQHRVAISTIKLGFPESKNGLFPGFGATVFASQLLGFEKALPFLTQGNILLATAASGLIDQIAVDFDDALFKAKEWIQQQSPVAIKQQHIDFDENVWKTLSEPIKKRTHQLIPGINACLETIYDSFTLPKEEALIQETERYTEVLNSTEALSMVRTQYFGIQEALHSSGPQEQTNYNLRRLAVLGAGMMGSGIAFEAARAGIDVVLKDVSLKQAEHGKAYAENVTSKLVQQGRMDEQKRQKLLSHIHPTEKMTDLKEVDLIIEAVFEDKELKAAVSTESLPYLYNNGFFASNTTSLPITELARVTTKPADFIGMHFFSPVDRMALVEIICGQHSSAETLAKALKVTRQLGKIPIVVHDGPAFFTSRIFFNYLLEAITMLLEGIPATTIDEQARQAGFAVGPLAVLDEISLQLMLNVYDQLPQLHNSQQRCYHYLEKLVKEGRNGRKSNKGFYDYDQDSGKKTIWQDPSLPRPSVLPENKIIQSRLLHVMALDSYRCLEEGVLDRPIDGDIGSTLGVGYAAQTGGVFGHIDQTGLQNFVTACQSFSNLGEQWEVPISLKQLAEKNFSFYSGFEMNWPIKS
ncbi:3-hydroxyacyl-CoA dehydrogenase NAD-binding domain-containing protein [Sphingobacterium sp. SRCM116780]|uniref:3-hydroxyacyl-CoA dehydrogenase NAD-binding domain-containing protein n=1 Tax=Sphingobacterium sp. SRCM116780 TaxID=2907623 RepID=UPI001F3FE3C6|nr:3-hydroxyacyl-CoA dehydrogenase NAD-binding domain-containing protein [Sphingobacterium sp. SRCM116780]UIR56944.1 3-hydroxyacyl-CoA dehydrogenase NAD-binding domain-containing protein [Sphingobacterium sp. SRCM116780]